MSLRLLHLLTLLALLIVPLQRGHAASFDPDLTWRSLVTEHFRITFHQGEEQLAEELSLMAEEIFDEMSAEMVWKPRRRIEVLLVDRTDTANGYASTVPYPRIVLFVTAPQEDSTLSFYEDWTRTIFTHELTHVLHLDTNYGVVRLARAVVGRIASTNEISPRWIVEGLATYQETKHTSGGRGRSPQVDMLLRTAVLEHTFPPLGNMDGYQPRPPGGNLRYLFGEDFIRYVADHQGEDVWTRWTHTYGSTIPYILPTRIAFGRQLVPMYFDWKQHLAAKYAAQLGPIYEQGPREGRLVSAPEASCNAPSFSPDGARLVWSCYDLRMGAMIWMADGDGANPEVLLRDRGAKTFTWRRDSKAFVFAGSHIVNRFNTWSDIYLFDLEAKRPTSLTQGARARDPDFSPDGTRLVMVTNRVQNNNLEVMTVDRIREPITDLTDHTQFSTPRFSPDGKVLAVSVWAAGRRDLWLYSPEGEPLRRLTADAHNDRDPIWSKDGRWLYFSSDRSGIPNVYALEIETEHLWQVTNVRTGAVMPSPHPNGHLLAYQQYSSLGWEVRLLDLDPARFIDRGVLPRGLASAEPLASLTAPVERSEPAEVAWVGDPMKPGPRYSEPMGMTAQTPGEVLDTFDNAEVQDVFGAEQDYDFTYPVHRYNPIPTLAPRFWLPMVQLTPYRTTSPIDLPFGLVLSASTGTSDMAAHYGWSAGLSYRTDANFLGGSAAFTVNRLLPIFTLAFNRRVVPFPMYLADDYQIDPAGNPTLTVTERPYWDRRHDLSFNVSYPYRLRTTLFARYVFSLRDNLDPIPADVYEPRVPIRGSLGRISTGWRYAWGQPTPYSISTEDGRIFSLVGSLLTPWLGSQVRDSNGDLQGLNQVQITAELNEYIVNPWVPNQVLALRVAAGAAIGATEFLGTYQLGGNIGDSPFYVTPDEFRMLRGYPFGADVGDYYWLAGAEYRFPLLRFERGVGTIPAYARTLSALAFIDTGNAITKVDSIDAVVQGTLVGVGGELRFTTVVGWTLPITLRFGYGTGFGPLGYRWNDPRTLYFRFGGSF